jgi:hypothetical protein
MPEVFKVIEVTDLPVLVDLRSGRVGGGAPLALFDPLLERANQNLLASIADSQGAMRSLLKAVEVADIGHNRCE